MRIPYIFIFLFGEKTFKRDNPFSHEQVKQFEEIYKEDKYFLPYSAYQCFIGNSNFQGDIEDHILYLKSKNVLKDSHLDEFREFMGFHKKQ